MDTQFGGRRTNRADDVRGDKCRVSAHDDDDIIIMRHGGLE